MLEEECPSGRKCFPSWEAAERSRMFIKRTGKVKNQGTLRRPYRCSVCRWYHLTSWVERSNWWD